MLTERLSLTLGGTWLITSISSIVLPIFLPSSASLNTIGTATVTMFVLSFPISLLGMPLIFFVDYALGFDSTSMDAKYLNLLVFFTLGLVQWFWIIPRFFRPKEYLQQLGLPDPIETFRLPRRRRKAGFAADRVDAKDLTPLERVLRDADD